MVGTSLQAWEFFFIFSLPNIISLVHINASSILYIQKDQCIASSEVGFHPTISILKRRHSCVGDGHLGLCVRVPNRRNSMTDLEFPSITWYVSPRISLWLLFEYRESQHSEKSCGAPAGVLRFWNWIRGRSSTTATAVPLPLLQSEEADACKKQRHTGLSAPDHAQQVTRKKEGRNYNPSTDSSQPVNPNGKLKAATLRPRQQFAESTRADGWKGPHTWYL